MSNNPRTHTPPRQKKKNKWYRTEHPKTKRIFGASALVKVWDDGRGFEKLLRTGPRKED